MLSGLPADSLPIGGVRPSAYLGALMGQEGGLRVPSPGTEPCLPPVWKAPAAAQGFPEPRCAVPFHSFQGFLRHTARAEVFCFFTVRTSSWKRGPGSWKTPGNCPKQALPKKFLGLLRFLLIFQELHGLQSSFLCGLGRVASWAWVLCSHTQKGPTIG